MKKIGIFMLTTLWILVIINIGQIRDYINTQKGIHFFDTWKFKEASQSFQKVKDITSLYNDANSLYKQGKFEEAIQKYWLITTWDNSTLDFNQYYNKGNSLYKQWIQDSIYREELRKQAISSYDFSLSLHDDEDTKYNKLIVEKALNKFQEDEQKNSSNNSNHQDNSESQKDLSTWNNDKSIQWNWKQGSQNNESQNSENTNNTNEQWTGKNSINSWNNENYTSQNKTWDLINTWNMNSWSWINQTYEEIWTGTAQSWSMSEQSATNGKNKTNNQQNDESTSNELSQEQFQAIQDYKKQLSEQQKQYGQYYNKIYKEKSNDSFERFFNDPFFNNGSLDWGNSDKKDW